MYAELTAKAFSGGVLVESERPENGSVIVLAAGAAAGAAAGGMMSMTLVTGKEVVPALVAVQVTVRVISAPPFVASALDDE